MSTIIIITPPRQNQDVENPESEVVQYQYSLSGLQSARAYIDELIAAKLPETDED
jgi:hypothetical protein